MRPSARIPHDTLSPVDFYQLAAGARLVGARPQGSSWRLGRALLWTEHGPLGSRHLLSREFFDR